MKDTSFINHLREILRPARPLALIGGILMYILGCGAAHYLGKPVDWTAYWLGQSIVILIQVSGYLLKAYYDDPVPFFPGGTTEEPKARVQRALLQSGAVTLTVGAVVTVLSFEGRHITPATLVILGIAFLLSFVYAVPPLRLAVSGYGELSDSILITNLIPALSFIFQAGELHRMLAMLTFPLAALFLAGSLAMELQGYAADIRHLRGTLMVRMGWQRTLNLHNYLVLAAYLLFGVAMTLGLSFTLIWPALLTLPLGIFQIWLIQQIAGGAKPRWNLLQLTAVTLQLLTPYLIAFSLWTK